MCGSNFSIYSFILQFSHQSSSCLERLLRCPSFQSLESRLHRSEIRNAYQDSQHLLFIVTIDISATKQLCILSNDYGVAISNQLRVLVGESEFQSAKAKIVSLFSGAANKELLWQYFYDGHSELRPALIYRSPLIGFQRSQRELFRFSIPIGNACR